MLGKYWGTNLWSICKFVGVTVLVVTREPMWFFLLGTCLKEPKEDQLLGVHRCLVLYAILEVHSNPLKGDPKGSDPSNAYKLKFVVWLGKLLWSTKL